MSIVGIFVLFDIYKEIRSIMSKKLILTETQFDKLNKFIVETKFDTLIKDVVKTGDIISIEFKNTTNNFKVISNNNGKILMDNIDAGSTNINYRFFITLTSLHGDDLELRRVHKTKEQDKLNDINSWKKLDVKDVKNIDVVRNNKVIDSVDSPTPSHEKSFSSREKGHKGKPHTEDFRQKVDEAILVFLTGVKPTNGLNIKLYTGEIIKLCCISTTDNMWSFKLDSEGKIKGLEGWDTLNLKIYGNPQTEDLYGNNRETFDTTDGGQTINLVLKGISAVNSKDIVIKGIEAFEPTQICASVEDEIKVSDDLKAEGKKALEMILKDPDLRAAFYKQPTLWNLFIAELKGKEASGSGIIPTLEILDAYGRMKLDTKLGAEFKSGKKVKFNVLTPVSIQYDNNRQPFTLDARTNYPIKVKDYTIGDNKTVLLDNARKYKIVINDKTNTPNVFNCDIVKYVETRKGITEFTQRDVMVRFLTDDKQYDGYVPSEETKLK